jgi:hypothetical protein
MELDNKTRSCIKEPLKPQVDLHYIANSRFCLTENTLHLHHRTNHLMQFMEIMLFIYEANKIDKYNVWQDAEFLMFTQVRYIC